MVQLLLFYFSSVTIQKNFSWNYMPIGHMSLVINLVILSVMAFLWASGEGPEDDCDEK